MTVVLLQHEADAVLSFVDRSGQRGRVPEWLEGGPLPDFTVGESSGGPWPCVSLQVVKGGLSVYRPTDEENAAGKAWVGYWLATTGEHGSIGGTAEQKAAAPPAPDERAGSTVVVPWSQVRGMLADRLHGGPAQPELFALAASQSGVAA